MLADHNYPITIAEMNTFMSEIDQVLLLDEQENVRTYLAFHPEGGDMIPGMSGVRVLRWPITGKGPHIRITYYFRDLNMPVYLLAVYRKGERIGSGRKAREEIANLIEELVGSHSNTWGLTMVQNEGA